MSYSFRGMALAVAMSCAFGFASAQAQAQDPGAPGQQAVYADPAAPQPVFAGEPQAIPMEEVKPTAANAVYVELGGNAGIYSLNYERLFIDALAVRVGFSFFSVSASGGGTSARSSLMTIPLMVNYIGIGNFAHHLELGGGLAVVYASSTVSDGAGSAFSGSGMGAYGTATAGYRFQRMSGGFVFRAAFTPLFGRGGFFPWGGVSLGAAF